MYNRITVVAILFFLSVSAQATVILSIDDGVNPVTIIIDGGYLDLNPVEGAITYVGILPTEDGMADVSVSTGFSAPQAGDALHPILHLDSAYSSVGAGQLTIGLTSTDFLGPVGDAAYWFGVGGIAGSGTSVDLSLYVDSSNGDFGRETLLATLSNTGSGSFSHSTSGQTYIEMSPFSMTIFATFTHTGAATTSFNAEARVPEPGTLALFSLGLLGLGLARRKRAA